MDQIYDTQRQPHKQRALHSAFSLLGAPALDVEVTVMSARAALLGVSMGRGFLNHETRGRVPMPPDLEPEVAVWGGGTTPEWMDGVLVKPKYFSFFQDAPLPVHDPNHRRKWRAHELLHGVLGFYWHPEQTRFHMYVGARLNELIPVVHWYGLDEIGRPRCDRHRGARLLRTYCQACEDVAAPFWDDSPHRPSRASDERFAAHALEHFASEFAACLAEIETGRPHSTPRVGLDASSDSIGYVKGHWNRCTAWSFGAWVELFLRTGHDYEEDLQVYAQRTAALYDTLLTGEITATRARYEALHARRVLQEAAYRALLAMEWLGEDSPQGAALEDALMPAVEGMAEVADALLASAHTDTPADLTPARDHLGDLLARFQQSAPLLPAEVARALPMLGDDSLAATRIFGAAQLAEGAASGDGALAAILREDPDAHDDLATLLGDLATSDALDQHGRLITRLAAWLRAHHPEHPLTPIATFDALLAAEPRVDEEADMFGLIPDDLASVLTHQRARIRPHGTLRTFHLAAHLVRTLLDPDLIPDDLDGDTLIPIAAARVRGEPRVALVTPEIADVLDALTDDAPITTTVGVDTVEHLLMEGLLCCETGPLV